MSEKRSEALINMSVRGATAGERAAAQAALAKHSPGAAAVLGILRARRRHPIRDAIDSLVAGGDGEVKP